MSSTEKNTRAAYILIKQGADINGIDVSVADEQGFTILHWATLDNNTTVVSFLLKENISIDAQDKLGRTALYFAITQKYIEIQASLLNEGANPSDILHIAAYHNEVERVMDNKVIRLFINFKNRHGQTPLHIAALRGQQTAVEILLENSVKINERDANGCTALDIAQKKNNPKMVAILLEKDAKNGQGFINSNFLYLHNHYRELQDRGYALILMMTLFLSEISLIHLMYSSNGSRDDILLIEQNALALPQNITQESAEPKIETENEIVCELKFDSENIPALECYDPQLEFLTHVFVKETPPETVVPEYEYAEYEYATPSSVEAAVSIHVTASSTAAHEHKASGDIYDLNTCKQIEYLGRKALHCEGEKTYLFARAVKKSDPLDIHNILNTINSGLLLGLFGVFLVKFLYNQYITTPENTDKKPDIILIAENDPDIQNFFQRYIIDDRGNREEVSSSEATHSNNDEKNEAASSSEAVYANDDDESEPDPFPDLVVYSNDAAAQHFFKIAEEKLQQVEGMTPKIRDDEGPPWLLSVFFQPRNSWVKNSILSIRENLDDLKTEMQIPKSDLYYIALDIYDLELRTKSNEPERPPSTFTPSSTSLLPVIGFSPSSAP